MADNVGYTPGTGASVAADEIGGVLYQRVKPVFGVDGVATDVSATDPLPVSTGLNPLTDAQLRASSVPVVDSSLAPVPDLLTTINDSLANVRRFGSAWGTDGRLRVQLDAAQALGTVSAVTTVTTVSTVTNQAQVGGYQAGPYMQAQMNLVAQNNIRNMVG